jgi:hypothetical protein
MLIDRIVQPLDRLIAPIGRFVAKLPTWFRIFIWLVAALLLALAMANVVTSDASFSINADSRVFTVEPACGQQLVWDLPEGAIGIPREAGAEPPASPRISVSLRGGARARAQVDGDGRWVIEFGRSDSFGCGAAADLVAVTTDGRTLTAAADEVWLYRSSAAVAAGASPVLLLKGRIVIGDEASFGSGAAGGGVPLLERARIDVRSPDAQTGQRRQIHDESIDPGGMIDTHGCLDTPSDVPQRFVDCVRSARSASEGFFRAVKREDRSALEVQLVVTGRHVGVRQQGGSERRVLVTWWSSVKSSSLVQMFAAATVLISALVQLWSALKREPNAGKDG